MTSSCPSTARSAPRSSPVSACSCGGPNGRCSSSGSGRKASSRACARSSSGATSPTGSASSAHRAARPRPRRHRGRDAPPPARFQRPHRRNRSGEVDARRCPRPAARRARIVGRGAYRGRKGRRRGGVRAASVRLRPSPSVPDRPGGGRGGRETRHQTRGPRGGEVPRLGQRQSHHRRRARPARRAARRFARPARDAIAAAGDAQRDILDAYSDATVEAVAVRDASTRLHALERRESDLHGRQDEVRRKADYLRHVVEEIAHAAPKAGEDEVLDVEAKRLTHADELGRLSRELEQTLETAGLARAAQLLGSLERLDGSVAKWRELLDAVFANVAELTTAVRDYAAEIEADPGRLAAVEQRRDLLYRLQQKYGPSLPDVLATRDASAKELELLDTADLDLRSLAEERATTAREFERACAALTAKRQTGARHLEQAVHELLPALGMPEGRFAVRIIPRTTHPAQGAEGVLFEIQLNVGLDQRPLERAPSGGDLARLTLALTV